MDSKTTYKTIQTSLNYDYGLVESEDSSRSTVQKQFFSETLRQIGEIDAIYFTDNTPIIFFKLLSSYDEDKIRELHRLIWNQSRIPLLYVITPGELRIYNCFEDPATPEEKLNTVERLIGIFKVATTTIKKLKENFSRTQIDSGAFWKSKFGERIKIENRSEKRLLENLRVTREKLHKNGLGYPLIHNLLGRSLFVLYLEDRGAINRKFYNQFISGSTTFFGILRNKKRTYELFKFLEKKFNGDIFPISSDEVNDVNNNHLKIIREYFLGTQMITGQTILWRPYNFKVIPIELISAIYEEFLRVENGEYKTSEKGEYYTPHPLVEFIMNEILPWPSNNDSEYQLKTLDPTCGSGIFLVETYRRLIERWKFQNKRVDIGRKELKSILTKYIYGIDINPDAIKVAAFSLYLAFLDYLEPKTIWEETTFPHLIYNSEHPSRSGKNLFSMNTIESGPFEKIKYDVIVGNLPWKRDGLPDKIKEYCYNKGFAQEMAQAFLWRCRDFVTNGKLALVASSKILFNNESKDSKFRHDFFNDNYVEMVVNLSILRKKRGKESEQLFTTAVGPACIFFFQKLPPKVPKSTIVYCTPKPTKYDLKLPGITIDPSDIKRLPREKCMKPDNKIWKVAMWGTQRDFEIIERFLNQKSIGEYISEKSSHGWDKGRGFNKPGEQKYEDEEISQMLLLPTTSMRRYSVSKEGLGQVSEKWFLRLGAKNAYRAPHVLIKEGLHKKRFCAAFVNFDCAFKYAVFGINGVKNKDEAILKALTAYLNSSFATYFLFLVTSTWGVERDRVYPTETLSLPGIPFCMNDSTINRIASKVDKISEIMSSNSTVSYSDITYLEDEIDEIIYAELQISDIERTLIEDVLNYSLDFFMNAENSPACQSVDSDFLLNYVNTFCETLNNILKFGDFIADATIYGSNAPLCLVSINIDKRKNKKRSFATVISNKVLSTVLNELEIQLRDEYSEKFYIRRFLKYYDRNSIHILMPNERRFWTRSMALRDADETLVEGIRGGAEHT